MKNGLGLGTIIQNTEVGTANGQRQTANGKRQPLRSLITDLAEDEEGTVVQVGVAVVELVKEVVHVLGNLGLIVVGVTGVAVAEANASRLVNVDQVGVLVPAERVGRCRLA